MNLTHRLSRTVSAGLAAAMVFTGIPAMASEEGGSASQRAFEEALDHFYWGLMELSPSNLHFLQSSSDNLPITLTNLLGVYSEDNAEERQLLADTKEALASISVNELTLHQRQIYFSLEELIEQSNELLELPDYASTLGASTGLIANTDTLLSEFYILSEADADLYLSFLNDVPRFLGEVEKEIDHQESIGYLPSAYTFDELLDREDDLTELEEHPYLESFISNIKEANLPQDTVDSYTSQVTSILSDTVIPAYQSFFDYLEEKEKSASSGKGLCNYDQGKEYYALLAKSYTGTDMTPDEMMSYLQQKTARDIGDMSRIIMTDQSVLDRLDDMEIPTDNPEQILSTLREKTLETFPAIDNTDYQISYLPEALEVDNIVAYYLTPPYDLASRNVIRVNRDHTDGDDALLWTTLAHEGFPGHLYQTQYYTQYIFEYPAERLLTTSGVQEGWALYVERLSLDWAGFDSNLADVYALNSSVSMAVSAMADIGVNYMGWNASELGDFLLDYFGELENDELQELYESLISDPAVYLAYGVGYYQICDLFDAIKDSYSSEKEMYTAFLNCSNLSFALINKYLGGDGTI